MFGFLVLWFIIGFVVVGYDVLNDIRNGISWKVLIAEWNHLLFFVIIWPIYLGVRK